MKRVKTSTQPPGPPPLPPHPWTVFRESRVGAARWLREQKLCDATIAAMLSTSAAEVAGLLAGKVEPDEKAGGG